MAYYDELPVYKASYDLLLEIFRFAKDFTKEYKYTVGESLKKETLELITLIYRANSEAETYLKLSQKQRALEDAFSQARRQILESPFPSLPEALITIVEKEGFTVSIDEASSFVKNQGVKKQKPETPKAVKSIQRLTRQTQKSITGSYAGKKVSSFTFNNKTYEVRFWRDVLIRISEILFQTHRSDFNQVLSLVGRKRPYYTKDKSLLRVPQIIEGTNIYVETNLSANNIIELCHDIIGIFGYSKSDLKISAD